MDKRLVLAVDVAQEMLRPLRQVQNRLEVDNLRAGVRNRREATREELQITQVVRYCFWGNIFCHNGMSFSSGKDTALATQ